MIAVAVLLLPALGVLLFVMDRVEERLSARPSAPRHARKRHLRLVHDAGAPRTGRLPARRSRRHGKAA
ncbi:hypothetical protein AB0E85_34565 [Streptomyces sp. NPDC029044]|uniref:hypothetical protein n=1 Tax=Streptomyces sp. NPDC029044 TaxID=3157198 RepID=UPI0033E25A07